MSTIIHIDTLKIFRESKNKKAAIWQIMKACQKMRIESLHSYPCRYNQTFRSSMMSSSTLTHLSCLFKIGHILKRKSKWKPNQAGTIW
jgi:hypothetical protein